MKWITGIIAAVGTIVLTAWAWGWVAGIGATLVVAAIAGLKWGSRIPVATLRPPKWAPWAALALGVLLVAAGWAWARYVSPPAAPAAVAPRPGVSGAAAAPTTPSAPVVPWPERPPVCEEFILVAGRVTATVVVGPGTIHRITAERAWSALAALPSGGQAEVPAPAGDSGWTGAAPTGLLRIVSAEDQRVRICRIQ